MTTNNDILDALSVAEVAELRDVSRQRVYKWIESGLAYQKDRWGRIFVNKKDAEGWEPMSKSPGRPLTITLSQIAKAKKMRLAGKTLAKIAAAIGVSKQTAYYHTSKP